MPSAFIRAVRWLPSAAASATTGTPEVRPSQSSRTREKAAQVSCVVVQSALRLRPVLPTDLRLAPPINLPALPSTRPPAFTGCRIVSAHPFTRPSTCVACRPSGPASRTNLRLSSAVVLLRFNLPIDLWLAPPINRPANPSNSTSGLHRLSHRPAHPFTRPSTCVACRPSGPAF